MDKKVDVAAISDDDTVILFNAVGIRTFSIKDNIDLVEKTIFQLANQKCRIIFVSEKIYKSIPETIEKYQFTPFPIIIPIPSNADSEGIGLKKIQENVEKAIGFNIF